MEFPLSFWDISLVLAVEAIVLLITSELVSPYYGRTNLAIEKKVLRRTALMFLFAFLFTILVRVYEMLLGT